MIGIIIRILLILFVIFAIILYLLILGADTGKNETDKISEIEEEYEYRKNKKEY